MIPSRKIRQPKIVQPNSGRRGWYLLLVLLPAVVAIASWYAYEYGRTGILFDSITADSTSALLERQVTELERQVTELEAERVTLYEERAVLERTSQIDREAVRAAGEEMKAIQESRLKMEEELAFLRGIVSDKENKNSLRVRDFRLQASEIPHVFQYSFIISQVPSDAGSVKGKLFITVAGEQEGKNISLELAVLSEEKNKSLKVDFKHFQKFEGLLQLPEGFVAGNMTIKIKPDKKKMPGFSGSFKWSVEE